MAVAPTMTAPAASGSARVQLDRWVSVEAPLTDAQRASVSKLSDWLAAGSSSSSSSLQTSSNIKTATASAPSTPALVNGDTSLPATPKADRAASTQAVVRPSLPSAPIVDAPAFLLWFAEQQAYISSATESWHERALASIVVAGDGVEALLDELQAARVHVAELRAGARFVEEGSEGLREEAEAMVEKMDHLSTLAEALSLRLSYFAILPTSTAFLSSPSLNLVLSPDFLFTLDRLDVGLAFVRAHPHYRDAALYRMRFEHCVVRAGQLIRMYATTRWRDMVGEAAGSLKEWSASKDKKPVLEAGGDELMDLADPTLRAVLHERFQEEAQVMRPLLLELEKRSAPLAPAAASLGPANDDMEKLPPMDENALLADYTAEPEGRAGEAAAEIPTTFSSPEFAAMLAECRTAYFDARRALLSGVIGSCIGRIEVAQAAASAGKTSASPLVRLVKRSVGFLRAVCRAEHELYAQYFSTAEAEEANEVQTYLQSLCASLHDRIRPRLHKEANAAALSELCAALLDEPVAEADITLRPLLEPLLSEAQAQLIARARGMAAGAQVGAFSPTSADLDYPARLGGAAAAAAAAHRRAQSSIGGAGLLEAAAEAEAARVAAASASASAQSASQPGAGATIRLFASPPPSVVRTWYAPVARTLTLLSLLHDRVLNVVFVEVASAAIDACRASLVAGAETMRSDGGALGRIGGSGRMDPPLFLLRHLLLLREMAASVQLSTSAHGAADHMAAAFGGAARSSNATSAGMIDFAALVDTLNALWASTSTLLDPRALYQLARGAGAAVAAPLSPALQPSSPVISAQDGSVVLSKLEQDVQRASATLIEVVAQSVALPLRVFMDQAKRAAALPKSPDPNSTLAALSPTSPNLARKDAELGSAGKARAAREAFERCAESVLGEGKGAMRAYLEDDRAIGGLVEPILTQIIESYQAFITLVRERHDVVADELPDATEMRERLAKLL